MTIWKIVNLQNILATVSMRERVREREKTPANGFKFMQSAVCKCVAIVMYIKYLYPMYEMVMEEVKVQ